MLGRLVLKRIYFGRYSFHWADLAWLDDEPFWQALDTSGESDGLNAQRRFFLREAALHCVSKVGGSTAECGAFIGLSSFLICEAHRHRSVQPRHYIFDSFKGLSQPAVVDGPYWRACDLVCSEEDVRRRLSRLDFVEYRKGWIPEKFPDVPHDEFCFVHIDADLAGPTTKSLEFFFPGLRRGGQIIVDDYGFRTSLGATEVVRQFVDSARVASLIAVPARGAALVKVD